MNKISGLTRSQWNQLFFCCFAVPQTYRLLRHNGRNRVFVDELNMSVSFQQNAKIIEPIDVALKFDPVDQENCDGNFCFSNLIEESVL